VCQECAKAPVGAADKQPRPANHYEHEVFTMATDHATAAPAAFVPQTLPTHLRRLYRAFVTPRCASDPERTFFVEAATHQAAAKKVAGTIAALEYTKLFEAEESVYNVASAFELVHDGISEDVEMRIWECGWSGPKVICWVEAPVFLVRDPAPLLRAWARIPAGVRK
jgi:hypothetical protein